MAKKSTINPKAAELEKLINKAHGAGVLIRASELESVRHATTGSLSLDLTMGGGWVINAWNEVVGHESVGKTIICLKTIAKHQEVDPDFTVLWIAAERYNKDWAADAGVDNSRVMLVETVSMEVAFEAINTALANGSVDAIVVDSYPALIPKEEEEKTFDKHSMTVGARMMGKLFRKTGSTGLRRPGDPRKDWFGIIINQWRDNVGVMFGDPRTTPGGKAKNFAFHIRADISRSEWITNGDKSKVGINIKMQTIKNKTSPPQRVGSVDFYFDNHESHTPGDYDVSKEIFNIARLLGVIDVEGRTYYFNGKKIGVNFDDTLKAFRSDFELQEAVESEVREVANTRNLL